MIWVLYARFARPRYRKRIDGVFHRVCSDVVARHTDVPVRIDEIASKAELRACVDALQQQKAEITEWHVVGYGTPYGPLLGSPQWPEEISALEWSRLGIPFAKQAEAFMYMADSDRWLAPFLAAAFGITVHGCRHPAQSGLRVFPPGAWTDDAGYDPIAALYAAAFSDIAVRWDECRWLEEKVGQRKPGRVLDVGCGNGALLARLSDRILTGDGVDISSEAVRIAAHSNSQLKNLSFTVIDGPVLPFADRTFDTVISMLSFRYLDWDPILEEMKRVLAPGGHILIVDMAAAAPKPFELPILAVDKLRGFWHLRNRNSYKKALRTLVTHPGWRRMVERHPMHPKNEMIWYLTSRFPSGSVKFLNTGAKAQILAFDSGAVGGATGR